MPTLPILPGPIQPGLAPAGGPSLAAAPADPTADPSGAGGFNFLDQLAAALASLTPAQPSQPDAVAPQTRADSGGDQADQTTDDTQAADQTMAELAASFGLVPLPNVLVSLNPAPVQPTTSDQANATLPAQPSMGPPAMLPLPPLDSRHLGLGAAAPSGTQDLAHAGEPESQAAQVQGEADQSTRSPAGSLPTDSDAPAAALATATQGGSHLPAEAAPGALSPSVPTPGVEQMAALAARSPRHADRDAASRPTAEDAPTPVATPVTPGAAPVAGPAATPITDPPRVPALEVRHAREARELGASTSTMAASPAGQSAQHASDGAQAHGGHADQHAASRQDGDTALPATSADALDPTSQTPPFSAALAATGVNAPNAQSDVHPRDVVAQIAHQAELYRLPGGRGVRIQLHPDDLGGVEVTVRYGPAGALELHVNVEHASTGALVQAGWTELRDALSQQGISPDRLVMSLSGPQGGGLSSDSGNSGSSSGFTFRSDAGPNGFGQSPSQSQQDRQPASGRTRWSPGLDTSLPQEPEPLAPVSSSRIDLRV